MEDQAFVAADSLKDTHELVSVINERLRFSLESFSIAAQKYNPILNIVNWQEDPHN